MAHVPKPKASVLLAASSHFTREFDLQRSPTPLAIDYFFFEELFIAAQPFPPSLLHSSHFAPLSLCCGAVLRSAGEK